MTDNIKWHSISSDVVDILNYLADFAEFNDLEFQIVLPSRDSHWWNSGAEYEVSVRVAIETPESDAFYKRSECRTSASSPGIHLELPNELDTAENRETLLYGAKAYLKWKMRMQVVTFGAASRGTIWREGQDAAWARAEVIELYGRQHTVRGTEARIFEPEVPNEIPGIRGNTLTFLHP